MRSCGLYRWLSILILIPIIEGSHSARVDSVTATDQLFYFLQDFAADPLKNLTTSSGYPVPYSDTKTIDRKRTYTPLILNDFFLESMTHLAAERIPERVVHGKGTGAFGFFKVTHDLSDICKADVFNTVGKITPVAARFSVTNERIGGSDLSRDVRGFAVKFYTKEGNYDFVGNDIEMFLIKDPILFPAFAHSFHPNPRTLLFDANTRWDFLTLQPESLHMFMRVFGDQGIPDGYRHMPSFGIHTFELLNNHGARTYVRFHLLPDLGIKNLTSAQAKRIQANDLNYATRDLYNAIAHGNFPTWTLSVQTIPETKLHKVAFNIFDVTKIWPLRLYPLRPIGILKLNRNPKDQFTDIEQLAFNPGNLVPGIRGVDTLFEARVLAYRSSHVHRLGVNFNKIHVNCPFRTRTITYNRDGSPPVGDNDAYAPNYYPSSFHGPEPHIDNDPPRISVSIDPIADNFDQARDIYNEMTEGERGRLVANIVESLSGAERFLQERAVNFYYKINNELGSRIATRLQY